ARSPDARSCIRTSFPIPGTARRDRSSFTLRSALDRWLSCCPRPRRGRRARALTPTHRVLHNVLHSTVQDLNHAVGGLPLRQLVILSRLASDYEDALDWPWIHSRMQEHGLSRQLRDHLWLTHRLAGMALP